jgi:hypothetical protein
MHNSRGEVPQTQAIGPLNLYASETRATIAAAISLVETLTPNDMSKLPALPPVGSYNGAVESPAAPQRARSSNPIQATNLLDWLIAQGTRITYQTKTGSYVLHCPCANTRPSLEVQPASNPQHGRYVPIGYATGCVFETEQGKIINAFDARTAAGMGWRQEKQSGGSIRSL